MVAIFRPRHCLGEVDISVTSGPVGVDVQFYLLTAFRLWATCYLTLFSLDRCQDKPESEGGGVVSRSACYEYIDAH